MKKRFLLLVGLLVSSSMILTGCDFINTIKSKFSKGDSPTVGIEEQVQSTLVLTDNTTWSVGSSFNVSQIVMSTDPCKVTVDMKFVDSLGNMQTELY